ncbi:hypothetical protein DFJ73DRAFT_781197 [Zopfochytrium polystomum]|nr:hypothetical protein DFJ73DRAFT_781197 [Zopfochytrium polystomum]
MAAKTTSTAPARRTATHGEAFSILALLSPSPPRREIPPTSTPSDHLSIDTTGEYDSPNSSLSPSAAPRIMETLISPPASLRAARLVAAGLTTKPVTTPTVVATMFVFTTPSSDSVTNAANPCA